MTPSAADPRRACASPDVPSLRVDLANRIFRKGREPLPPRIGMEVELLPRLATGGVPPLEPGGDAGSSTLRWLGRLAARRRWKEGITPAGSPRFTLGAGGSICFEPGGQIEYASPPMSSVDGCVAETRRVIGMLREAAAGADVVLVSRGIDPSKAAGTGDLQLRSERYQRLAAHLERSAPAGPAGASAAGRRMMLETAALHVNLDLGPDPPRRWRAANVLVPYFIAAFASSPRYGGRDTGWRSFRSRQWRALDPLRTGVVGGAPEPASMDPGGWSSEASGPIEAYLAFALNAGAFLLGPRAAPVRPFREWIGSARLQDWEEHLGTLFPEVRPRGRLELRCFDALSEEWLGAPLVFATGLLYDRDATEAVLELLPMPDRKELAEAGRTGVRDRERADLCGRLFDVALEAARRLGGTTVSDRMLDEARAFRDRFSRRGRDPGDEPVAGDVPCGISAEEDADVAGPTSGQTHC